jgi:hypothetical protein
MPAPQVALLQPLHGPRSHLAMSLRRIVRAFRRTRDGAHHPGRRDHRQPHDRIAELPRAKGSRIDPWTGRTGIPPASKPAFPSISGAAASGAAPQRRARA